MTKGKPSAIKSVLQFFHIRHRTGVGYLAGFAMVVTAEPTPLGLAIAGGVAALGEVVRFWSSGTLYKVETLATTGPFALVRNPLYLGSTIIAIGFCLANRNPVFIVAFGIVLVLVYIRTIRREERLLREAFGDDFEEYRRRVPLMLPYKPPLGGFGRLFEGFSVRQAIHNNELDTILGIAMLLGVLAYPAFVPGDMNRFRLVISIALGVFLVARAILFPILKSESSNPIVKGLQFVFTKKKYRKARVH